jgi:septal ring factor EnvC (AmiA/AmiB activator)
MRYVNLSFSLSFSISVAFVLGVVALAGGETVAASEAPDVELRLADEEAKLGLLNEKLAVLEDELASLGTKQTTLLGELHRLDIQIRVANEQLELLGLQLKRGYREIDDNLKRIQALEASIAELKPYLEGRAVSLYKLGRVGYVRMLLSVEQPSELTRAYRYISRLAREDTNKMSRFLEDQNSLEESKAELLEQTERTLATREQLEATTRSLSSRKTSRATLLEEVSNRREMAGTLVYELEQAREKLGTLVANLISGELAEADTIHLPMRVFEGEIGWPVAGELEGRFGAQLHPRFQTVTVRNGIEIEAPEGATVSAIYDGEIAYASWFEGYGKLLIVSHPGGVHSLYGYLSDFSVEPGASVRQGDPIAIVGDTGSLAGPRLYFEIRVEGTPVDPEGWLDPARKLASSPPPAEMN